MGRGKGKTGRKLDIIVSAGEECVLFRKGLPLDKDREGEGVFGGEEGATGGGATPV